MYEQVVGATTRQKNGDVGTFVIIRCWDEVGVKRNGLRVIRVRKAVKEMSKTATKV